MTTERLVFGFSAAACVLCALLLTKPARATYVATPTPTGADGSTPIPTSTPTPSAPDCPGDCNGDGAVAINELITAVNIALGNAAVSTCAPCDADGNGSVAINELIRGVNAALCGCGQMCPTPPPSATPSQTLAPTPTPTDAPRSTPTFTDVVVTLGESKIFDELNLGRAQGTASSDGQQASAYVDAGPYQSGISQAWAGVSFRTVEGSDQLNVSDAVISITLSYELEVDFDALPPSEYGGGSADVILYGWIVNYKKEFDKIVFLHNKDHDVKTGILTFTHRLSDSPTWTHLYAGNTYEVKGEVYAHAQIYGGRSALARGQITIEEIAITFDQG